MLCLAFAFAFGCGERAPIDFSGPIADWPEYGGDKGGTRYSPLTQITPANVTELEVAWTYRHGDASDGSGDYARTSFQTTPIAVNGLLYFCTGFMRIIALHPETGDLVWVFDPDLQAKRGEGPYPLTCRGVAYWEAEAATRTLCQRRIFLGTRDSELIAVDADSGEACPDFGVAGRVSLREGLGDAPPWEYYPTSPPVVVGDVVVLGALVADSLRTDAPSGVVRGFDARTGEHVWAIAPVLRLLVLKVRITTIGDPSSELGPS
jgi:quinoprotein glucose dehydrogenase